MGRLSQSLAVMLTLAGVCCAQMQRLESPRLVPLRLIITIDGDVDKAAYATVELMDAVGLADDANTRVGKYSKGMQMRLTFARSLINDPELLFLDEPTSGLDPVNARTVKNMILDLKARGRTVFLTTHDMATANELCDRVAFIVDGRIVALDTPTELKIARSQRLVRVEYRGQDGGIDTADFSMDGLADDPAFHAVLRDHHVETVHSKEASLDDVFVETTGRRLS